MASTWVTFDCFGTLVDWNAGFKSIIEPLCGEKTGEVIRAYHQIERELEAERPLLAYREVLSRGLYLAATKVGAPIREKDASRLPALWGRLQVFPDVEPMLDALRSMGFRLAVLTNCEEDLFDATQRQFRRPFDMILTAERVQSYKPDHGHFNYFAQRTAAGPGTWVHVANSWFHDIAPAREFGIPRIWLDRDLSGDDPGAATVRVLAPADVPAAVESVFGSNRRSS